MSWKVHETDDVFAALRGMCSNSYRMYDPSEHRSYYDHDCETYECVVEDAAREYQRLLAHCKHQRQELAKLTSYYIEGKTLKEQPRTEQNGVAMDNIDNGTEIERIRSSSITDELRECARNYERTEKLCAELCAELLDIADRIDERHAKELERMWDEAEGADLKAFEATHVKLPVDADGEIIRIGDNMTNGTDLPAKVRRMVLDEHGWKLASVFAGDSKTVLPTDLRHVKPDSWERIIADAIDAAFAGVVDESEFDLKKLKLVERCRRLAGE